MKCFSCGIEKDLDVLEVSPHAEADHLCDDPIPPLSCIECESRTAFGKGEPEPWRMVVVCHECFHRLEPDMWINEYCWELLNPVRSFDSLPFVKDFPRVPNHASSPEKWNPRNYA
jgi:hypothetical protein